MALALNLEGASLGHYEDLERLGAGAMGEVYAATDTRLKRRVALKVLPTELAGSQERLQRFRLEAEAIAALEHPNIITIHSLEQAPTPEGTVHFLTMELVEGVQLADLIPHDGLPLDEFYDLASQLCGGVAAAHERGVIHRDLKPANIMIARDGQLKILDFGLAKLRDPLGGSAEDSDLPTAMMTAQGQILGTPAYMAPEQIEAGAVDARADVFALGSVLYEMLTGSRPFAGESLAALQVAILTTEPESPRLRRTDLPPALDALVTKCLRKDPAERFDAALAVAEALREQRRPAAPELVERERRLKKRILIPAAATVVLLLIAALWLLARDRRRERIRNDTLPEIARLLDEQRIYEGYGLAVETANVLPDDPQLGSLIDRASGRVTISTEPTGAEVFYKDYREPEGEWQRLGTSPLEKARIPRTYLRLRLVKPGFDELEVGAEAESPRHVFHLTPQDTAPEGMVWVPAGRYSLALEEPVEVPGFWLGRYEVTNREFQEFVDAGGYREPDYWTEPFELQGERLGREEAMRLLVDSTGRPGPATWRLGRPPDGKGDHPVRGVSWYEAAAYAAFAGKSLPSFYQWRRGAPWSIRGELLLMSNVEGEGPAPVGSFEGIGRYGHSDLAGNVSEWCWNRAPGDQRYILGGSWLDPSYVFTNNVARDPFERQPDMGFRLAVSDEPVPASLMAEVGVFRHDFAQDEPVPDDVFEFYRSYFDYDPQPLAARLESVDDSHPDWRRETVSFTAAYANERVLAYLFLPRNATPPFQTVVYVPHSGANWLTSIDDMRSDPIFFVPRSGRALVWPIYKGTLERGGGERRGPRQGRALRDAFVQRVNDLQRTVDYVETREDLRGGNLGFVGLSFGAEYGPLFTAIETRFKAVVYLAGGFDDGHMLAEPPEVNPLNYAPRVSAPVLMINGESDYGIPVETAQRPMLELLGTPTGQKRHAVLAGGHMPYDWNAVIRETLDWFDLHLGPIEGD